MAGEGGNSGHADGGLPAEPGERSPRIDRTAGAYDLQGVHEEGVFQSHGPRGARNFANRVQMTAGASSISRDRW